MVIPEKRLVEFLDTLCNSSNFVGIFRTFYGYVLHKWGSINWNEFYDTLERYEV